MFFNISLFLWIQLHYIILLEDLQAKTNLEYITTIIDTSISISTSIDIGTGMDIEIGAKIDGATTSHTTNSSSKSSKWCYVMGVAWRYTTSSIFQLLKLINCMHMCIPTRLKIYMAIYSTRRSRRSKRDARISYSFVSE